MKNLLFLMLVMVFTFAGDAEAAYSYSWQTGNWTKGSNDTWTRTVTCRRNDGRRVSDFYCKEPKPATTKSYSWSVGSWSSCSASACGTTGTQTRSVQCLRNDGVAVSDSSCSASKPATSQSCSTPACYTYGWKVGNWSKGANDVHTRSVECERSDGKIVADSYCKEPKPNDTKSYSWSVGEWSACSATACGTQGTQTRSVQCLRDDGVASSDSACSSTKPATSQSCSAPACFTYSWKVGNWSKGANDTHTRSVECERNDGKIVSDTYCKDPKPASTKSYAWSVGEWGSCSATACGTQGTQTRDVKCLRDDGVASSDSACSVTKPAASQSCSAPACYTYSWKVGNWSKGANDTHTRSVECERNDGKIVADSYCKDPKPADTKSYAWATGDWSSCSATACGTQGTQTRTVQCLRNDGVAANDTACSSAKPAESQVCEGPCSGTEFTYNWEYTAWGQCSATACGTSGVQVRSASCVRSDGVVMTDNSLCTSAKESTERTCSAPACSVGTAPVNFMITPSFKTAGVILNLQAGAPSSDKATLYYRVAGSGSFEEAHEFTRYDKNNMATSIFNLKDNTPYELRVDYLSGGKLTQKTASFQTKLDTMNYPVPKRVVEVSSTSGLKSALLNAKPGDHIILAAGVHKGLVNVSGVHGTEQNPIVIRGAKSFDPFSPYGERAIIDGQNAGKAIEFVSSSFVILDNLEIKNGGTQDNYGTGVSFSSSYRMTVQNSYIHDNGKYNVSIGKSSSYVSMGGPDKIGHHLIQNNFITDTDSFSSCPPDAYTGCAPITYYGVSIQSKPAGANVIRNNLITRHIDNISSCGDFSGPKYLSETTEHVLKLTGSSGEYFNHNTEIYGNIIHSSLDDDIEMDGVCVNLKVYDNVIGNPDHHLTHHPLTTATAGPGPFFIFRNIIKHYNSSALKLNTSGSAGQFSRNVFLYHNTFIKSKNAGAGALVNLWYGGSTAVGAKNIRYINNIFYAPNGSRGTDINTNNYGGKPGTLFNYNLWYTPTSSSSLFEWYDGSAIRKGSSFSDFQSISGQESYGVFAHPKLDNEYKPAAGSSAIDGGVVIPGINHYYQGSAPDIGARETNN